MCNPGLGIQEEFVAYLLFRGVRIFLLVFGFAISWTKAAKRKYTKNSLAKELQANIYLGKHYKERYSYNGQHKRRVLWGFYCMQHPPFIAP